MQRNCSGATPGVKKMQRNAKKLQRNCLGAAPGAKKVQRNAKLTNAKKSKYKNCKEMQS